MVKMQIHEPQPLVSLHEVTVTAPGQQSHRLLTITSLTIHAGERLVVSGSSGSGKSLLLSLLTGTTSPALTVEGSILRRYQRCGFIPQRGIEALHPLIAVTQQLQKITGKTREQVEETLRAVGLDPAHVGRRRPAEISGGQAQRIAIALAVLADAELIIADEPTSALDAETRDQTLELLLSVLTDQQTLVLTTHDPEVAAAIDGTTVRVEAGSITLETPAGRS